MASDEQAAALDLCIAILPGGASCETPLQRVALRLAAGSLYRASSHEVESDSGVLQLAWCPRCELLYAVRQ